MSVEDKKSVGIRIGNVPGIEEMAKPKPARRIRITPKNGEANEPKAGLYKKKEWIPRAANALSEIGQNMPYDTQKELDNRLWEAHVENLKWIIAETLAGLPNKDEIMEECEQIGWENTEKIHDLIQQEMEKYPTGDIPVSLEENSEENNLFNREEYPEPPKDYDKLFEDAEKSLGDLLEEDDSWKKRASLDDEEDEEDEEDDWDFDDDEEDEDDVRDSPRYPRPRMKAGLHAYMPSPDERVMRKLSREKRNTYIQAMECFAQVSSELGRVGRRGVMYNHNIVRSIEEAISYAAILFQSYGEKVQLQTVEWLNSIAKYDGMADYITPIYYLNILDIIRHKLIYNEGYLPEELYKALRLISEFAAEE